MTTIPSNDYPENSANQLYEDRTHFQAIFSNDSRFFDTSLHLFKSYCAAGYIQLNEDKVRKHHVPLLTAPTHGYRHRWKARLLGIDQENDHQNGTVKAFLTPTLLRRPGKRYSTLNETFDMIVRIDQLIRNLSDSKISADHSVRHQQNSPLIIQYQKTSVPTLTVTDESDSEITITRL